MKSGKLAGSIQDNFQALRTAVEERRYDELQWLLKEQRALFQQLDFQDEEARQLLQQGQELTHWALTLTTIQHAHTERALASVLKLKQLDHGYMPSPVCSAEFVSVRG